ncbi:DNA polymerase [Thiomonas sp.]
MNLIDSMVSDWDASPLGDTSICVNCGAVFVLRAEYQAYCPKCKAGKPRAGAKAPKRPHKSTLHQSFVAWDGEGENARYTLLANNLGESIANRAGLRTKECLDFLLSHSHPHCVNIWFSFGYDVSMILSEVDLLGDFGTLEALHDTKEMLWKGYKILYIPRKIFSVIHNATGRSFTSYDVFSFFQSKFEKVVKDWVPDEVPPIIARGKAERENFDRWSMEDLAEYNLAECVLLSHTMDKFRQAVVRAGMKCDRWYGPGAIAKAWMKQNNLRPHIAPLPADMIDPVAQAYFGGRIEDAAWGHLSRTWHYDINSAYPYALCNVPSLANLSWRLCRGPWKDPDDFDLVQVDWAVTERQGPFMWGPLPYREKDGSIKYPPRGKGWYWGVEVKAAMRRFPNAVHVSAYYHTDGERTYPFRDPIRRDAALRLELKAANDPANIPLKLALNSLYGILAQRKGFGTPGTADYRLPPYQCYAWAGYITAHCRGMLNDAIALAGGQVALVMTDSVWSCVPLALDTGPGLGQWSYEEDDVSVDICGAGLYQSYDADGNTRPKEYKSRGFSHDEGEHFDYAKLIAAWEESLTNPGAIPLLKNTNRRFVGIGMALASKKYAARRNEFIPLTKTLDHLPLNGYSKRMGYVLSGTIPPAHGLHWMAPWQADTDTGEVGMLGETRMRESAPYKPAKDSAYDDEEALLMDAIEEDND